MIAQEQLERLTNAAVYDRSGEKVGNVRQVFIDDTTGAPSWVSVHTGLFGTSESFVPVHDARIDGDRLMVGEEKQRINEAPRIDPRADQSGRELLEDDQVTELYRYYNLPYASRTGRERGDVQGRRTTETAQRRTGREAPSEMTRYEEQMRAGKETVESGRVRLRKYVTTEDVTTTVPVRREEVRVEREPVSGGRAEPRHQFEEEEAETTLYAERPVVEKEAVPVEKVRMEKQTQAGEERVGGQVRKEHVEVEDESQAQGRGRRVRPDSRR